MDFRVGDEVRIKTEEEMRAIYTSRYPAGDKRFFEEVHDGINFVSSMRSNCGAMAIVDGTGIRARHLDCGFWWPSSALEYPDEDIQDVQIDDFLSIIID